MKSIRFLFAYASYYFRASTKHHIHSPFVFELLTQVIERPEKNPRFIPIEKLRNRLRQSREMVEVTDLGAGSSQLKGVKRKVSDLVRYSAKSPKYGQLLYRLSNHFKPINMLELGTSLGISTLYLSLGNEEASTTTIEGCPEIAALANKHFSELNNGHIEVITGEFGKTLPAYLQKSNRLDLVFFDGNHRREPTLDYFRLCMEKANADSLFIFDDIHWSEEMEQAWAEIKNHPDVTVTIDLFFIGLVFFRKGQEKQHFTIRF